MMIPVRSPDEILIAELPSPELLISSSPRFDAAMDKHRNSHDPYIITRLLHRVPL